MFLDSAEYEDVETHDEAARYDVVTKQHTQQKLVVRLFTCKVVDATCCTVTLQDVPVCGTRE